MSMMSYVYDVMHGYIHVISSVSCTYIYIYKYMLSKKKHICIYIYIYISICLPGRLGGPQSRS